MHSYLKSVGFALIENAKQEKLLLDSILENPQKKKMISNPHGGDCMYAELSCEYAPGIGVRIIGEYDEYEQFRTDSYYPYCEGRFPSVTEECYIAKKMDSLCYSGICEDYRLGVSMIFQVNNTLDCINRGEPTLDNNRREIRLSGLASEGRILLPTLYTKDVLADGEKKSRRAKMISEAKNGSREALEALAFEEIDNYASIGERVRSEDVFSIVETTFIPYGMETEVYKVLGIIESVDSFVNPVLQEKVYLLKLLCNEVVIDVCINEKNLSGEPLQGRRFRGIIWLQGKVFVSVAQ